MMQSTTITVRRYGCRILIAVTLLSVAIQAYGQPSVRCASCRIDIDKVGELNSARAPIVPSMSVSVARAGANGYLVSYLFRQPQIVAYDAEGRYVHTYERTGSGPGEFGTAPILFVANDDTIIAAEQSRLVRFSADLHHIDTRTVPIRISTNTVVTNDGFLVVGTPVASNSGRTYLASIVSPDGRLANNIDPVESLRGPQRSVLGHSRSGGFWSGRTNSSDLVLWSSNGTVVRRLLIERPWFEPWDGPIFGEPYTVRPRPRTVAIRELAEDRLAVLTYIASSDWKPLGPPGTEIAIRPTTLDGSALFDTVIEIVDSDTGRVYARETVPQRLVPIEGANEYFASTGETVDGHVIVDVWRLTFNMTSES